MIVNIAKILKLAMIVHTVQVERMTLQLLVTQMIASIARIKIKVNQFLTRMVEPITTSYSYCWPYCKKSYYY